jgi:hypothetical protein
VAGFPIQWLKIDCRHFRHAVYNELFTAVVCEYRGLYNTAAHVVKLQYAFVLFGVGLYSLLKEMQYQTSAGTKCELLRKEPCSVCKKKYSDDIFQ